MTYEQIMRIGVILFASSILLYLITAVAWSWITRQLLKPISSKRIEVYRGVGGPMFNIFKALWRDWQDQYQRKHPRRRRGESNFVASNLKPLAKEEFTTRAFTPAYARPLPTPSTSWHSGEGFDGPDSTTESPEPPVMVTRSDLRRWQQDYIEEHDPHDDTDVVTPFDKYLYH